MEVNIKVYFLFSGVYGPKDVIQLNAPSDISMFERLKGSLKEFLNSQIMPQVNKNFLISAKQFFLKEFFCNEKNLFQNE